MKRLPFSHREHDIYLVTRIDAFTVDQAMSLVDKAQNASTEGRLFSINATRIWHSLRAISGSRWRRDD